MPPPPARALAGAHPWATVGATALESRIQARDTKAPKITPLMGFKPERRAYHCLSPREGSPRLPLGLLTPGGGGRGGCLDAPRSMTAGGVQTVPSGVPRSSVDPRHESSPRPVYTCSPVGVDGPEVPLERGGRGAPSPAAQPRAPHQPAVTICGRPNGAPTTYLCSRL